MLLKHLTHSLSMEHNLYFPGSHKYWHPRIGHTGQCMEGKSKKRRYCIGQSTFPTAGQRQQKSALKEQLPLQASW